MKLLCQLNVNQLVNTGSDQPDSEGSNYFFFSLEKRKFTDWNLIICRALLQQVRRSSAFKYRPKLFREAAPTLHSWGVWTRQRPFITLMKCAFHLRRWEQNIKTPRIITLKQVPLCDNFLGRALQPIRNTTTLWCFFWSVYGSLRFTHPRAHTHKRVALQQINEREEKLVSRDSWFGSRSNRRRRGGTRENALYETWKERADACFFAVRRGRGGFALAPRFGSAAHLASDAACQHLSQSLVCMRTVSRLQSTSANFCLLTVLS